MKKNQNGFGLVEMILIILLIGLLATLSFVAYRALSQRSNSTQSQAPSKNKNTNQSAKATANSSTCTGGYSDNPASITQASGYTKYTESNSHITFNQPDTWGTPSVTLGAKNENKYGDGQLMPSTLAYLEYSDLYLTISKVEDYYYYGRFVGWDYYYNACAKTWTSRPAPENTGSEEGKQPSIQIVDGFPIGEFTFGDAGSAMVTYSLPIGNTYIFSFMAAGDYTSDEQFSGMKSHLLQEVQDFLGHNKQFSS